MDDFSYSSDIAPMRGEYFSSAGAGLTDQEKMGLTSQYNSRLRSSLEEESKAMESMINTQRQQLEFEKTKLAIESVKKETRDQLEAEKIYPEIMDRITSILDDKTKDGPTKVIDLEKTRAAYGPVGIKNPAINNIFNSATSAVSIRDQKEAQREAIAAELVRSGLPDAFKSIYGGDVESGYGKELYDAARSVQEQNQKILESKRDVAIGKEQREAEKQQIKERRELEVKILDDYEGALRNMVPKGTSEDDILSLIQSGQMAPKKGATGAAPIKPQFNPLQVREMKEIMLDLNPSLKPTDVESVPTEELYSYTFRLLKKQRRGYLSTPKNSTQSLFEQ